LYVFGPFLKLIVAAEVAQKSFGGSVWLAVITILVVSAVYRKVMQWIIYGSGGNGLNEEEEKMREYLESIADPIRADGLKVSCIVSGSNPERTIVDVSIREGVDLMILTSQGRGGLNLLLTGSVTQKVVQSTDIPVFIVPINQDP
jgi:nucleotide-binding universal stress UspA family protein